MKGYAPLVSVIMPTYKRPALISRAIKSVVAQTYQNWELIIWDGYIKDDTEQIVKSFNEKRIQYINKKDRGAPNARNRAIKIARGEYLAFLDTDDVWNERFLSDQIESFNKFQFIDVIFTDFFNINESTGIKRRTFEEYKNVLSLLKVKKIDPDLFLIKQGMPEILTFENFIGSDTVVFRRTLFEKIGPFNEELKNCDDFEMWWRMSLAGKSFAYLDKINLTRYKPTGSLSSPSIEALENRIKGLNVCLHEAIISERNDLIPQLNKPFRNTWQNMITVFSKDGNLKGMMHAYFQTFKYGINLGSFRLFFEGILFFNKAR